MRRAGVVIYRLPYGRVGPLDSRFTLSTVALARFHFTNHTVRGFCSVGVASDLHNQPYDSEVPRVVVQTSRRRHKQC